MVFGLALSVGALSLVAAPPSNSGMLYQDIATFGFSFLILITVWIVYTRTMSVLQVADRQTMVLNTALLFTVSIEPFLFNLIRSSSNTPDFSATVTQAYALDLGVMMVILGFFAWTVTKLPSEAIPGEVRAGFRREAVIRMVGGAIFFATVAPVFAQVMVFNQDLRTILWIVPLVLFVGVRRREAKPDDG